MRLLPAVRALVVLIVVSASAISAQSTQSVSSQSVPRLINVSGVFQPANGQPASAVETVTLSIYADPEGGPPLWQETQTIALDAQGRYALLLGATQADGIPAAVFGTGEAKWLGTVFERAGEVEGPRVRITSVPYALRASDADTLGGRPASAYLLAPGAGGTTDAQAAANEAGGVTADIVLPGTPNFLAKYVNGVDVGNSGVFEAADGAVGMGTTTPFDRLHVRYDNNTGDFTGLAVQNTNGGAFAYSGMLFYDHTNALTQFQGYNNATHEYRINNIARVSPGGAFNGSINFMIGGTSRFFVGANGSVGIGTTSPCRRTSRSATHCRALARRTSGRPPTGNTTFGPEIVGRKAQRHNRRADRRAVRRFARLLRRQRLRRNRVRLLCQYVHAHPHYGELDGHGARDRDRVLDHGERDHRPDDTDDHRCERERRHRRIRRPGQPGGEQRERRLGGRDDFRDDFHECGHLSVRRPEGTRHGNRANGRAERRQPRGLPRSRLWDHWIQLRAPRWPVRQRGRELDGRGTGHETPLPHDGHRHEYPADADDNRPVRERRHRDDGAVGSPGYGEGKPRPLGDQPHAIRGNIEQRRTKHRAADGARNQSGSECRAGG